MPIITGFPTLSTFPRIIVGRIFSSILQTLNGLPSVPMAVS
jgi:hypothetical protein